MLMDKKKMLTVGLAALVVILVVALYFVITSALRPKGGSLDELQSGTTIVVPETETEPEGNTVKEQHTLVPDEADTDTETDDSVESIEQSVTVEYVNSMPTPESIAAEKELNKSLYGRLVIPVADINVALYESSNQVVVNAEDSAALFKLGSARVIADYWAQGFSNLSKCAEGSEAYIVTDAGSTLYLCSKSENGSIARGNILFSDSTAVGTSSKSSVVCYSQTGVGTSAWVVEFTSDGEPTTCKKYEDGGIVPGVTASKESENKKEEIVRMSDEELAISGAGYEYSVPD